MQASKRYSTLRGNKVARQSKLASYDDEDGDGLDRDEDETELYLTKELPLDQLVSLRCDRCDELDIVPCNSRHARRNVCERCLGPARVPTWGED